MANGIRFIRVNGRVIPIKDKGAGSFERDAAKGQKRVNQAARRGNRRGALAGAAVGAAGGAALLSTSKTGKGVSTIGRRLSKVAKALRTSRGRLAFAGMGGGLAVAAAMVGSSLAGHRAGYVQSRKEGKKLYKKYGVEHKAKKSTGVG